MESRSLMEATRGYSQSQNICYGHPRFFTIAPDISLPGTGVSEYLRSSLFSSICRLILEC